MIFGLSLLSAVALMLAPGAAQGGPACSATALNLTPPAQARPAACGLYCDTSTGYVTGLFSGSGSSCAAALSDLTAQISAYAGQRCMALNGHTRCNVTVYPAGCATNGPGVYTRIGYGDYYCADTTC